MKELRNEVKPSITQKVELAKPVMDYFNQKDVPMEIEGVIEELVGHHQDRAEEASFISKTRDFDPSEDLLVNGKRLAGMIFVSESLSV